MTAESPEIQEHSAPTSEPAEAPVPVMSEFAADLYANQPFRGYELIDCLGSHDAFAVFSATDHSLDRTVIVKAMRPWTGREGMVEDFFSLAGSIAGLRCPNVARGLDAGRGGGAYFMVYEKVPGESLAARLARRQIGRLTEKESLKLAGTVAGILKNLFELGHPHGRVKPSNIMLAEGGRAFLTDIGFSWTIAWPDDDAAFVAAPDCLPPEKFQGELNIDIRGDLYSLGAVWYEGLLGRKPFTACTPADTLKAHLEGVPVPPRELDPRLTPATSRLILWLLEKDRDARPRTPREFLRKLTSHPLLENTAEGDLADSEDSGAEEDDASSAGMRAKIS